MKSVVKRYWPTILAVTSMVLDSVLADAVVKQYLANHPDFMGLVLVVVTAISNAVNPKKQ